MSRMQNCLKCSAQCPPGAKFCRQCGAALYRENDETLAQTRQYGRDVSAPYESVYRVAAAGSEAVDTSRFYRPPAAADYSVPQPTGSPKTFRLLISVLALMAVIGVVGALAVNVRVNRMTAAEAIRQQVQERIAATAERDAQRQAEIIAREAERQAEQATRIAEQAAGIPVPPLPPLPPVVPPNAGPRSAPPAGNLIYPGAEIESDQLLPGKRILRLKSGDSVDKILDFYGKRFDPDQDIRSAKTGVLTKKEKAGQLVITVNPHPSQAGQSLILVVKPM